MPSFFNLAARSTSSEAAYLSKERRIPPTELMPHLELIRSSEVDPIAAPGARTSISASGPRSSAKASPFGTRLPPITSSPTAPSAKASVRSIPPAPIFHDAKLMFEPNEPLRASFRTAVANMRGEVGEARAEARTEALKATRAIRLLKEANAEIRRLRESYLQERHAGAMGQMRVFFAVLVIGGVGAWAYRSLGPEGRGKMKEVWRKRKELRKKGAAGGSVEGSAAIVGIVGEVGKDVGAKEGNSTSESALRKADRKEAGWKSWFWAQPG